MLMCSECANAAFASSGVYCMALGEAIFDEAVAETCGLYEGPDRLAGGPGEADIISLNGRLADEQGGETTSVRIVRAGVVSSSGSTARDDTHISAEQPRGAGSENASGCAPARAAELDEDNEELDRVVMATVEVGYFGRARDGRQVLETLRRMCQLQFGRVEVR